MNQNFLQKIYHANVNKDLIEENVIQINDWITMNVDMSVKSVMYLKKVILGDWAITCNEVLEETKTVPNNFNEKKQSVKHKSSIFCLLFYLLL